MLKQFSALHQVMRDRHAAPARLQDMIHKRLHDVLISAYEETVYYNEIMRQADYNPKHDYRGPQDLRLFPPLTKEIIKERGATDIIKKSETGKLNLYFQESTSGSTGIPLTIYRSPDERALQIAKWLRVLITNGYRPYQKALSLTRHVQKNNSWAQRFGLFRRETISLHSPVAKILDVILAYKPQVIYGNRSSFDPLFDEIERRGVTIGGLHTLIMTAECINKALRKRCREVLGLPIIDSYGSHEMGVLAYETPTHDGLHLSDDLTYFEFLDEQGKPAQPDKPARIIVTDLSGKLMPFIRYDQGDRVIFRETKDQFGHPVRRIVRILGRDNDFAILSDGSQLSFMDFAGHLNTFNKIKQFRVIQEEPDFFRILLATDRDYFNTIKDQILTTLQEHRNKPTYKLERVDRIPPDANGKLRILITLDRN